MSDERRGGLQAGRTRPAKLVTLAPETWERLDKIAKRWRVSRAAAVERLVLEAELPRKG